MMIWKWKRSVVKVSKMKKIKVTNQIKIRKKIKMMTNKKRGTSNLLTKKIEKK